MQKSNGRWFVYGIVSFGPTDIGCGSADAPDVYTRVTGEKSFISQVTGGSVSCIDPNTGSSTSTTTTTAATTTTSNNIMARVRFDVNRMRYGSGYYIIPPYYAFQI